MTGAGDSCYKLERVYHTTWRHIPENNNLKKYTGHLAVLKLYIREFLWHTANHI
jgi:hypothetical protein